MNIKNRNIDEIKVALVIRQLEESEVLHESQEVEAEDVETLLALYGIFYEWNDDEKELLWEHLLEMALQEEYTIAERRLELESNPILSLIPAREKVRKIKMNYISENTIKE